MSPTKDVVLEGGGEQVIARAGGQQTGCGGQQTGCGGEDGGSCEEDRELLHTVARHRAVKVSVSAVQN